MNSSPSPQALLDEVLEENGRLTWRIREVLVYMSHVKQPNENTLAHIRRHLTGEYDNLSILEEKISARTTPEPPRPRPVQPESKVCGVQFYDSSDCCVRAKGHPHFNADGIGHSLSEQHREK